MAYCMGMLISSFVVPRHSFTTKYLSYFIVSNLVQSSDVLSILRHISSLPLLNTFNPSLETFKVLTSQHFKYSVLLYTVPSISSFASYSSPENKFIVASRPHTTLENTSNASFRPNLYMKISFLTIIFSVTIPSSFP